MRRNPRKREALIGFIAQRVKEKVEFLPDGSIKVDW